MTALYSYQGQEPQELPERIRLSNGRSRTDSSSFTAKEIEDAGFTGPYERPEYNSEVETQEWNSESEQWITTSIPEEIFWERLRDERNFRLMNSDWSQLPDTTLTTAKKTAWTTYRQVLRDLPANTEDPKNVTWPSQPE
jgi:hypothetical protein